MDSPPPILGSLHLLSSQRTSLFFLRELKKHKLSCSVFQEPVSRRQQCMAMRSLLSPSDASSDVLAQQDESAQLGGSLSGRAQRNRAQQEVREFNESKAWKGPPVNFRIISSKVWAAAFCDCQRRVRSRRNVNKARH